MLKMVVRRGQEICVIGWQRQQLQPYSDMLIARQGHFDNVQGRLLGLWMMCEM